MNTLVKTLDSASGALFMAGLISSKLRYLPIPLFSSVIGLASLGFYFTGYLIWLIACKFYTQHPKIPDTWFGFLPIDKQHFLAASIGLIAMGLCFGALTLPILGVAGSWLFAISNLFWNIAEYHRFKNPSMKDINPHYSHQQQAYYLSYATLTTMISIMTAAILTASFFFAAIPLMTIVTTTVTLLSTLICISAFYFLYKSLTHPKKSQQTTIDHKECLTDCSSYTPILQQQIDNTLLDPTLSTAMHNTLSQETGRSVPDTPHSYFTEESFDTDSITTASLQSNNDDPYHVRPVHAFHRNTRSHRAFNKAQISASTEGTCSI